MILYERTVPPYQGASCGAEARHDHERLIVDYSDNVTLNHEA